MEPEWPTGDGPVDIFLPGRRVIIEVKKGGRPKNGPDVSGTGAQRSGESAYEQLERYISAERTKEQQYLDDATEDITWLGCITDARRWWIYEWEQERHTSGRKLSGWQGTTLTKQNIGALQHMLYRQVGKPWAPADPSKLFDNSLTMLQELYEREKDVPATITQRGMWLQQLQASGNAPADDQDAVFVRHTLLILITRLITQDKEIRGGFVQ